LHSSPLRIIHISSNSTFAVDDQSISAKPLKAIAACDKRDATIVHIMKNGRVGASQGAGAHDGNGLDGWFHLPAVPTLKMKNRSVSFFGRAFSINQSADKKTYNLTSPEG
jgi:hypothetical protein